MSTQVLLVDDDSAVRDAVAQILELADLESIAFNSFVATKDMINADFKGVILSDIRMPGRDGFFLSDYAKSQDPDLPVILLTGEGDVPMAVSAMRQGAFGFLEKPCAPKDLLAVIECALRTRDIIFENRRLRILVETGDSAGRMLFGQSEVAEAVRIKGASCLSDRDRGSDYRCTDRVRAFLKLQKSSIFRPLSRNHHS